MSFQAVGAIAKFKRANRKKKNLFIHQRLPSTHLKSRKVSSNSAQVNFKIQLQWFGEKQQTSSVLQQFHFDWLKIRAAKSF